MANAIGLFHTRLNVRKPILGAPELTLDLVVNTVTRQVFGSARITQPTHPVREFHADLWGEFAELPFGPGGVNQLSLHLDGNPSGRTSELAETFHLQALLAGDWAQGNASYRFFDNGHWTNLASVPVRQAPDVALQAAANERLHEVIRQLESA
ncbi:DUF1842 domain-containing protein [Pseudomonas sp. App30]|uniref:DUF1842 domain-containing protein n=1 Tax=Pseudomonas sp. App30 TaxID=3068990 RepID=UPI003A80E80D